MSSLSNMPAQAVLPLAAYDLAALRKASERADQRWIHADCSHVRTRAALFDTIAKAAKFPAHFGGNLDALYDCVTDLKPDPSADKPGIVFVLEGLPDNAEIDAGARQALIDVFREAADHFYDRSVAFRVFYSVRRAATG